MSDLLKSEKQNEEEKNMREREECVDMLPHVAGEILWIVKLRMLRWGHYLGFSEWVPCHYKHCCKREAGGSWWKR